MVCRSKNLQSKFYNDSETLEKVWQFTAENEKENL